MSDENDVVVDEDVEEDRSVDPNDPLAAVPQDNPVAIFPELDGKGGTIYREGTDGPEVSHDDWAAQNVPPPGERTPEEEEAVTGEDRGLTP
jgi:hypothetical protein